VEFPSRNEPLCTAWLTWQVFDSGPARLAFRQDRVHVAAPSAPASWFCDGRFLFDIVSDFAWHGFYYWLVTPVGVVSLQDDGTMEHSFSASDSTPLEMLKVADGELYLMNSASEDQVWQFVPHDKSWQRQNHPKPLVQRLRAVVHNQLFTCTPLSSGSYELRFRIGDRAALEFGNTLALLQNGVFGFDDVRDIRIHEDRFYVASRLGVWQHDLANQTPHVPTDGALFANAEIASGRSIPMSDLRSFQRPFTGQIVVESTNRVFQYGGGSWNAITSNGAVDSTERKFSRQGKAIVVKDVGGRLAAHWGTRSYLWDHAQDESLRWSGNLTDIFETDSAVWIPLGSRLLWLRK
jgi:hypothetical protein